MSDENPTPFELAIEIDRDHLYGEDSVDRQQEEVLRDNSLWMNMLLEENRSFLRRYLHISAKYGVSYNSNTSSD